MTIIVARLFGSRFALPMFCRPDLRSHLNVQDGTACIAESILSLLYQRPSALKSYRSLYDHANMRPGIRRKQETLKMQRRPWR